LEYPAAWASESTTTSKYSRVPGAPGSWTFGQVHVVPVTRHGPCGVAVLLVSGRTNSQTWKPADQAVTEP